MEWSMAKVKRKPGGYANRTPWPDAIREVPAAWLEDAAQSSPSPASLLAHGRIGAVGRRRA